MQYSEKVLDHFTHPRNVGEIEDANGVGEVGNAKCGDIMKIYLKVSDDGIIEDVKFKTFVHEQEQPLYRYELDVPCDDAVNAKVFVIDDSTHSTMLLAEEY